MILCYIHLCSLHPLVKKWWNSLSINVHCDSNTLQIGKFWWKGMIMNIYIIMIQNFHIHSLWPCDTIWHGNRTWSTSAQVMACCLTAPIHHMNQCWLNIRKVLWHLSESNFTGNIGDIFFICVVNSSNGNLWQPHLPGPLMSSWYVEGLCYQLYQSWKLMTNQGVHYWWFEMYLGLGQ